MVDLPSVVAELLLNDTDSIGRRTAIKQASGFGLEHDDLADWGGG